VTGGTFDFTNWLTGMLAIASVIMCVGLWPLVRAEWRAEDQRWRDNKALRLAAAFYIHGIGAVVLFASPFFSEVERVAGLALYLAWAAFGMWLLAKVLIISVSGRLRLCMVLFAVWSAFCALAGLIGGNA
jgi:hypothetical protein